jgi:hypothetical protein
LTKCGGKNSSSLWKKLFGFIFTRHPKHHRTWVVLVCLVSLCVPCRGTV